MPWDGVPLLEVEAGRYGLWGLRNRNLIAPGGLIAFRNATLEDNSWRSGGGASKLGSAIGSVTIRAAIDYWPTTSVQRTLVVTSDGKLQKDDGSGGSWAAVKTGLTLGTAPFWCLGGQEQSGNNRKAFYCDGANIVQVLSADGAGTTNIASPPADWAAANQPRVLAVHMGYLWGGGNANSPHRIYRSLNVNHEDFLTDVFSMLLGPEGDEEYITAALSYKTGLLVWKFPEACYFVNTADPIQNAWTVTRIATAGAAGPGCVCRVEDDVIWVDPFGGWHAISQTAASGSVEASDISATTLGAYFRDNINLAQLATAQMIYYSHKRLVMLACHGQGQTNKNRRFDMDFNLGLRQGTVAATPESIELSRWIFWDRDRNEALYLRKKSGIRIPAMGDASGQIWELDRTNRNAEGAAYTFEWWTSDMDLGALAPEWRGKYWLPRFLQLEHDPRSASDHSVEVYLDGNLSQTIAFSLSGGPGTLPVTLPFTFTPDALQTTRPRRLKGRCRRISLRGRSTAVNNDVSLTKVRVGVEPGA